MLLLLFFLTSFLWQWFSLVQGLQNQHWWQTATTTHFYPYKNKTKQTKAPHTPPTTKKTPPYPVKPKRPDQKRCTSLKSILIIKVNSKCRTTLMGTKCLPPHFAPGPKINFKKSLWFQELKSITQIHTHRNVHTWLFFTNHSSVTN